MATVTSFLELLTHATRGRISINGQPPVRWTDVVSAAARKAGWFHRRGADTPVGVVMDNSLSAIETFVGAYMSGRGVVSLPLPHRGQHPSHYLDVVADVAAVAGCDTIVAPDIAAHDDWLRYSAIGDGPPRHDDSVIIQCSSGTTGTPKLIPLSSRQLTINLGDMHERLELDSPYTTTSWLPLGHDMGLVGLLFTTWTSDGNLRLSSPEQFLRNPLSWIDDCAGSYITGVPNFALDIVTRRVDHGRSPHPDTDLSTLRHVILGGEPVHGTSLYRFHRHARQWGLQAEAYTPAYGMAEICLTVSCDSRWRPPRLLHDGHPCDLWSVIDAVGECRNGSPGDVDEPAFGPVLLGPALPHNQVAIGVDQRIVISSPALTDGYIGEPPLHGTLVTADSGVIVNGEIAVLGRVDDVIVVRGRKVWPERIETVIGRLCHRPGGAVFVDVDGLCLAVTESDDHTSDHAARVRTAAVQLGGIGPDVVAFVPDGSLPKTSSGKKKRQLVRQQFRDHHLPAETALWTFSQRRGPRKAVDAATVEKRPR